MNDFSAPRTVALTGATGFVGARILRVLLANSGVSVRALTRQFKDSGDRLTWITGDLMDQPALRSLIEGADAVIHCAGRTKARNAGEFDAVNVTGTRNVARVVRESNTGETPHFVHMSSFAAREPQLSDYAASKNRGEEVAIHELGRTSVTILRPPAIFGPGDREVLKLLRSMSRGIAPQAGPMTNRFSLIQVDDLAEAVMSLLWRPEAMAKTFEIDDGVAAGYSMPEIAEIVAEALDRKVMPISIPGGIISAAGLINELLSAASGAAPMLSRGKARELVHADWTRQGQSLESLGFWAPSRPAIKALPEAIEWHRAHNQL